MKLFALLSAALLALPAGTALADDASQACAPDSHWDAEQNICVAQSTNDVPPLPPVDCPSVFVCVQPDNVAAPAFAGGANAVAIGAGAQAHERSSLAIGEDAQAHNISAVAIGRDASANSGAFDLVGSVAIGFSATTLGAGTTAVGDNAEANAATATALGSHARATGTGSTAVGSIAQANGTLSTAVGNGAQANEFASIALGHNSRAEAEQSVALGTVSIADEPFTVSLGNDVVQRRIVNVAPGQAANNAATMGQIWPLADALGGGANYGPFGFFNPPSYLFISGANYSNVGDALADLDGRVWALEQDGGGGSGPMGPQGYSAYEVAIQNGFSGTESEWLASLVGPEGPQGEPGTGGGEANPYFAATGANDGTDDAQALADNSVAVGANSVADEENTVSVGAVGNERRITNVAEGINDNDAVNVAQMRAADEWNFQRSRDYTDQRFNAMDQRVNGLERRIDGLDLRINQTGAMNAAMAHQTSAGASTGTRSSVSAGVGYYNGASALAVGYNRNYRTQTGRPISVSIGGAFSSGGEVMVGAGVAVGLR